MQIASSDDSKIPLLTSLEDDNQSTAILVFPTKVTVFVRCSLLDSIDGVQMQKALAQDQKSALEQLVRAVPSLAHLEVEIIAMLYISQHSKNSRLLHTTVIPFKMPGQVLTRLVPSQVEVLIICTSRDSSNSICNSDQSGK